MGERRSPHLMKPGLLRKLTRREREAAREVFGDAINYRAVRLWACPAPVLRRAFVAGHVMGMSLIVWPARSALKDFADVRAPIRPLAVLMHELTHVWQAQGGVNLLMAKIRAGDSLESYRYALAPDLDFAGLNIEQQAMVVQDAFLRRRLSAEPQAAELYARLLPFGPGTAQA